MLPDAQERDSELRLADRIKAQALMTNDTFCPRRHADGSADHGMNKMEASVDSLSIQK